MSEDISERVKQVIRNALCAPGRKTNEGLTDAIEHRLAAAGLLAAGRHYALVGKDVDGDIPLWCRVHRSTVYSEPAGGAAKCWAEHPDDLFRLWINVTPEDDTSEPTAPLPDTDFTASIRDLVSRLDRFSERIDRLSEQNAALRQRVGKIEATLIFHHLGDPS